MRVLVTGASGFIGSRVASRLAEDGHELMLLSMDEPRSAPGRAVVGDLGAPESYIGAVTDFAPDSCAHLAWSGIPDFSPEVCRRNLDDSVVFLTALTSACRPASVVISGTCLEYGVSHGACPETREPVVTSYFTWAKISLLQFARVLAAERDFSLRWLRIFYAYGPGQRSGSLIPTLVEDFESGRAPSLRRPDNANDYVYVDDAADAFARAAVVADAEGAYNVGSGVSTTARDISALVERLMTGSDTRTLALPAPGPAAVDFWADPGRSLADLGWTARTSLEDGVKAYLDWRRGQ